jgi:hypothetical protein
VRNPRDTPGHTIVRLVGISGGAGRRTGPYWSHRTSRVEGVLHMLKKIMEFLTLKWLWDRHKDKR